MRRQAAYLRVSTAQQDEALQREAIERAAAARGERIDIWCAETRARDGISRPELDRVRGLARRGELSRLWLYALDRLTGRGAQDMLALVSEFRRYGCELVSIADPFDLTGPQACEMLICMLGWSAQQELGRIRDRTAAAKRKAEAAGKHWGRPPAGEAEQRAMLRQLIESGLTLRKAAKEAGLSYGTAQRIVAGDRQDGKK